MILNDTIISYQVQLLHKDYLGSKELINKYLSNIGISFLCYCKIYINAFLIAKNLLPKRQFYSDFQLWFCSADIV